MTAASPLIRTRALAREYHMGDNVVRALRHATIEIGRGEFVAIMGPSGSGKSTFMNLLGCLDRPSAGEYWFDGVDVATLDSDELAQLRNRKIGFVFQNFNLLARTSAVDNIAMPLLYSGMPSAERLGRAMARLAQIGLGDRAHHHPGQLSGGQQQRVAIARALVNDPLLVLADEPTGALDSRTGVEIMAILQELNTKGMTVVLVTHEPDIARFAGRVITFKDGEVRSDAAVANRQVAADQLRSLDQAAA
ncbi:MAG: ABC transporter ATP-binding protein [Alphaproteobacteria bacterium]|nr:ABC transporter ATP-binding protein [Alphaproteobacteria bacterium]